MNRFFSGEAKVHYGAADFTILNPGGYVLCAVTGDRIEIDQLRYWSHERQEAYRDASASLEAFQKGRS